MVYLSIFPYGNDSLCIFIILSMFSLFFPFWPPSIPYVHNVLYSYFMFFHGACNINASLILKVVSLEILLFMLKLLKAKKKIIEG